MMENKELESTSRFLFEIGHLKLSRRTGWWQAGVPYAESIAEHSFRTAIIGYVLASLEEADPELTATICIFHDIAEARLGDIPNVANSYISHESEISVVQDQVEGTASNLQSGIVQLITKYREGQSHEAQLAKDADRLECILQAREYEQQGFKNTGPWMKNNQAKLKSESARKLADIALEVAPDIWWKTFGNNQRAERNFDKA